MRTRRRSRFRDLFLAQRSARAVTAGLEIRTSARGYPVLEPVPAQEIRADVSPLTTPVYTHPSDEEMSKRVRSLPC